MTAAPKYFQHAWRQKVLESRTPTYRRVIYSVIRPVLSAYAAQFLSRDFRRKYKPDWVLFSRGYPLETRRKVVADAIPLKDSTVLIQGAGTGWGVPLWAAMKPQKIIAVDMYEFQDSWPEITAYCKDNYGVDVEFRRADLADLNFLASSCIDICVSEAVLEHCLDLAAVMRETHRVLNSNGRVYAGYGPLWFAPGGDHFSGRSHIKDSYNHISMLPDDYLEYFDSERNDIEDFQSGGRYVEIDLFSKLRSDEYFEIFKRTGFDVDFLVIELTWRAIKFRKQYPSEFSQILLRHPSLMQDDLVIKGNHIMLKKT